jgi:hypothetical protein
VTENVLEWETWRPRMQHLSGLKFFVACEAPRPRLGKVADSVSGLRVFRIPAALSRAGAVRRVRAADSREEVNRWVAEGAVSAGEEALVVGGAPGVRRAAGWTGCC